MCRILKKLEESFGSSKRTLINNPSKWIYELYFMPTDLQRHFYRKEERADTSERVGLFRAGEAHRQILKQKSLLKVSNDSMGYEWKPTGNYTAYASLSSLTDLLCGIKKIVEGDEVMQQGIDNRNAEYIPFEDKALLSVKEMCVYLSIGQTKCRELLADPANGFTVRIGNRLYAHRKNLDNWLKNQIY